MRTLFYLCLAGCGILSPRGAWGQSLKDILNSSTVKDVLTSVTGGQSVSAENLRGTWTYVNPALRLEGGNTLKNVTGSLASAEIEKKMKEYCAKVGIVEGVFNYTFNADSTFTNALKKGSLKGTYAVNEADKTVTLRYTVAGKALDATTLSAEVILLGDELTLLFNADKLLRFLNTISSLSSDATSRAVNKLTSEYEGMTLGFDLKR